MKNFSFDGTTSTLPLNQSLKKMVITSKMQEDGTRLDVEVALACGGVGGVQEGQGTEPQTSCC